VRGNPQALFGKRPTEKDPAKDTSPAVDFTWREAARKRPGFIQHEHGTSPGSPPYSYGFRPGRGCHDAIEAIYQVGKGASPARRWALDADLAAALDA
jgi:hypothetical protein